MPLTISTARNGRPPTIRVRAKTSSTAIPKAHSLAVDFDEPRLLRSAGLPGEPKAPLMTCPTRNRARQAASIKPTVSLFQLIKFAVRSDLFRCSRETASLRRRTGNLRAPPWRCCANWRRESPGQTEIHKIACYFRCFSNTEDKVDPVTQIVWWDSTLRNAVRQDRWTALESHWRATVDEDGHHSLAVGTVMRRVALRCCIRMPAGASGRAEMRAGHWVWAYDGARDVRPCGADDGSA